MTPENDPTPPVRLDDLPAPTEGEASGGSQIFPYAATHELGHHVDELEEGTTF